MCVYVLNLYSALKNYIDYYIDDDDDAFVTS